MRYALLCVWFTAVACQVPDGRFRPPDDAIDEPLSFAPVSGDGQSAVTSAPLAAPFVVGVMRGGLPLAGAMVHFQVDAGDGALSQVLVSTDAQGQAASTLTVGSKPGQNTVEAQLVGTDLAPVVFNAIGQPGSATQINLLSGNNQSVRFGIETAPLVVEVVDKDGNPVAGFTVAFRVTGGNGVLTDATAMTDATGRAQSRWFVGGPGTNTVESAADPLIGSPLVFSASVSAFAAVQSFASGSGLQVLAADLSGDGKPDVATVDNAGGNVFALRNTSTSAITFASAPLATLASPFAAVLADLNGDGKLDIAASYIGTNRISTFVNTTSGAGQLAFSARADNVTAFSNGLPGMATADMNGDGMPDLITFDTSSNAMTVAVNGTTPGAAAVSLLGQVRFTNICGGINGSAQGAATGDVNGDHRPDVLVVCGAADGSNTGKGTVVVLLNTTGGPTATLTLAAPKAFTSTHFDVNSIATGDFDGDGRLDIAVTNGDGASVSVLLNQTAPGATTAAFAAMADFAVGPHPVAVIASDLNGDGRVDIATANRNGPSLSVLANVTPGSAMVKFESHMDLTLAVAPKALAAADLNGDGKVELIGADPAAVSVFLGQ